MYFWNKSFRFCIGNICLLFVRPTSEFPHPLSRVKQPVAYRVSLYYQLTLNTHTCARAHTHLFFYCKCTLVSIPYHINIYPNSKMYLILHSICKQVKTKWSLNRECKWNCQTPISIQTSFYLAFSSLSMLYKLQLNCLSYFLEIFWGLLSVLQSCLFHSSHR